MQGRMKPPIVPLQVPAPSHMPSRSPVQVSAHAPDGPPTRLQGPQVTIPHGADMGTKHGTEVGVPPDTAHTSGALQVPSPQVAIAVPEHAPKNAREQLPDGPQPLHASPTGS